MELIVNGHSLLCFFTITCRTRNLIALLNTSFLSGGVIRQIRFILSNHRTTDGNPHQEKLFSTRNRTFAKYIDWSLQIIEIDDKLLKIFRQK